MSLSVTSSSDTTKVVADLRDNILYRFQVKIVDVFGNFSVSAIVEVQTVNVVPPEPTLYSVIRLGDRAIFRWSRVDIWDFTKYEIVHSVDTALDTGDSVLVTITDIDMTDTEIVLSDTSGATFFVVVHDNTGLSAASAGVDSDVTVANNALQFNGSHYATIPYFAALDVGGQYTLEAWVKMTSSATYMRVIDKSPVGSPYLQYSLICDPQPGADVCNGGAPARFHANQAVALNEWHHVALTYDNGVIIYYVDGAAVDTSNTTISQTCSFPTTLNIGRRKMFDEFYFRGMIDEVRVWSSVRTPGQISATYNVHLIGNESGLVCYYDFDEGAGDVISSPVGGDGHLGEVSGVDARDPFWVVSTAPISY